MMPHTVHAEVLRLGAGGVGVNAPEAAAAQRLLAVGSERRNDLWAPVLWVHSCVQLLVWWRTGLGVWDPVDSVFGHGERCSMRQSVELLQHECLPSAFVLVVCVRAHAGAAV
jgi:hypothetical protein